MNVVAGEREAMRKRILGRTLVVLAVGVMLGRGIEGVGASNYLFQDFDYFYGAGKTWLAGESPYNFEVWPKHLADNGLTGQKDPFFAYPPTFAPLAMAFAWMDAEAARLTMALVNCLALALMVWLTVRMVTHPFKRHPASDMVFTPYLLAAFVIGSFSTTIAFWICQTSFVVGAALIGGWYLAQRGWPIMGGVLLAVAAVKPQFAALPMLWMLLERRWKVIATFTVTSLALAAYPMWLEGPIEPFMGFLHNIDAYDTDPVNQLGDRHLLGLPSLIVAMGGPAVKPPFALAIAGLLLVLVWRRRRYLGKDDELAILVGMTVTLVAAHPWDLVIAAPIAATYWLHAGGRTGWMVIGFFLATFYNMPHRVMRQISEPMEHWPTMALSGAMVCLLIMIYLEARKASSAPAVEAVAAPSPAPAPVPERQPVAQEPARDRHRTPSLTGQGV